MSKLEKDVLAGITSRTTKRELASRLEKAAAIIKRSRSRELKRLQAIEARVREKWSGNANEPLLQIVVQGTEAELRQAVEFLTDLEDVAPHLLRRLHVGATTLLEENTK
jgi:hypothetical protein